MIRLLLERQGLDAGSVPEAGRQVLIQRNGNVAIDCTDDVHPDVAYQVGLAARIVGLDIAGIDPGHHRHLAPAARDRRRHRRGQRRPRAC